MTVKIARLNFWHNNKENSEENSKEIMQKVGKELKQRKVEIYDGRNWGTKWHFGNYCLPGVPYDIAIEIVNKYNLYIDLEKNVIEKRDLEKFNVGDKVTIEAENMLAGMYKDKGTVVNKNNGEITIRKYRSKKKGWRFKDGDIGSITLGW